MMKNKMKIAIVLLLIPMMIGAFFVTKKTPIKETEVSDDSKRIIVLEKGELYSSVNIKGTIQSNEVSSVSTNLTTKVIQVNVKVGDIVKKGDIIAKLDDSSIQHELKEKMKEIGNEKSTLQEAYNKVVRQKEVAISNKNAVENEKNKIIQQNKLELDSKNNIVVVQQTEFDDAKSKLDTVESNMKALTEKYSSLDKELQALTVRQLTLVVPTEPTQPELPTYSLDKAEYDRLKAEKNVLDGDVTVEGSVLKKAKEVSDKKAEIDTVKTIFHYDEVSEKFRQAQQALLSAKEAKKAAENAYSSSVLEKQTVLKELNDSVNSIDETIKETSKKVKEYNPDTLLKELNEKLNNTILKAESDGKITELKVNVGSVPSGTIATIQSTNKLMISAKVQDYDISKISVGQKVKVTTDAFKDEVEGVLSRISPTASSEGDFEVDIALPSSDKLFIGTKARAEIVLFSKKDVIKVPIDAIVEKDEGSFILVKQSDGTFKEMKVTKNDTTELYASISGDGVVPGVEILANADWNGLKDKVEQTMTKAGGF